MRGANWARITLTVLSTLTVLLSLLLLIGQAWVAVPWLIGGVACIICSYVGGANDWYRYRKEQRRQGY